MPRIALILTDLEVGGTPTVVRELALRLHRARAHVEVVALSPPGPLQQQLCDRHIKCTPLGARGPRDFPRTVRRLLRLLRQERIDTVASFLIHANSVAAATRALYPRARYFQSIQTTQPGPRWHWALQRLIAPAADRLFVPSASVAAAARQRSGIPFGKIVVIPNAVDTAEFSTPRLPADDPHSLRVGFIGRLDPIKRIGDLVQALALLPHHAHLHIYGEGSERPRIEHQVASLHLQSRVHLHGAIARPQEALASTDILVLPSAAEGFGLILIEAMAAGVPVVATNVPGIRDVVRDGHTGLLVPAASPSSLASAIQRIQTDPDLCHQLTRNARTDVARRFSWNAVWPLYANLFGLPHPRP